MGMGLRVESTEEAVEVITAVVVVKALEDAKLVAGECSRAYQEAVLGSDAAGIDVAVAVGRINGRRGVVKLPRGRLFGRVNLGDGLVITLLSALGLLSVIPEPRARSNVVDVLLDVTWEMVLLARDVGATITMLPDVEVGVEQVADLLGGGIELNPLESLVRS